MVSWISSIIRRRRSISYIATTEASSIDSTCTIEYYDDTYYEGSTRYDYNKIKDLIKDIKTKKVYPWELESPTLKFVKKIVVDAPNIFDRKFFINAYKSARSTMAKIK